MFITSRGAEGWRFGIGNIPAAEAGGPPGVGSQWESRKDNSEVGENQRVHNKDVEVHMMI